MIRAVVEVALVIAFTSLVCASVVLAVVNLLPDKQDRIDSFKTHCAQVGGHLYAPDVILCLGDDGQVLEVYP